MTYQRVDRISEEFKKIISRIIRDEVKDPRIAQMTSITQVQVSKDLRYVKVYVSVLGSEEQRKETMEGLNRASGYIRKQLGRQIKIRYTPELQFVLDKSIEYSVEISKKINEIKKGMENTHEGE